MGVGTRSRQRRSKMTRRRAVFLDRDGVINRAVVRNGKPYPPRSLEELEIVEGCSEALASLKELGLLLIVVTNQPDVARGTQSREAVERIHNSLLSALPIDEILCCFHDDKDISCDCRKPKPGLLLRAAQKYALELSDSFLIGDRWRDIDAAHAVGCRAVWIDQGYDERGPTRQPEAHVDTLAAAVAWILREVNRADGEISR
jgi:D-glycero-D-manno-heptose 1,7-bisphosphate phosphatase